jgi:hypothetical protein
LATHGRREAFVPIEEIGSRDRQAHGSFDAALVTPSDCVRILDVSGKANA